MSSNVGAGRRPGLSRGNPHLGTSKATQFDEEKKKINEEKKRFNEEKKSSTRKNEEKKSSTKFYFCLRCRSRLCLGWQGTGAKFNANGTKQKVKHYINFKAFEFIYFILTR